ncbi:aminodeoxychorismate lyase [Colwellia sp. 20A7]|uniref:aminodeoxychorismate lyase n=1 Tax=Colwellia sp. 20A7 TaxID=2689569 RepID=UPI0013593D86|nr:aminodeoxychorismate lyase [Colwellia sp. 20A7]
MKLCLVNGIQQHHIDIESRGLAYGDGLFTTAKVINGKVAYLTQHVERLTSGCEKLGITPPSPNELTLQLAAIAKNYPLAVLKVIIAASSGGRGYARSSSNHHDLIIMIHDYPTHYDDLIHTGINLGLSKQQIGINPMLGGLKHLNRLEQVLLRQELSLSDVDDLLVTNINDNVIEATSANVFFCLNDTLYTPDVSQSGVNGIMRQTILRHYPETIIKAISLEEIAQAQAMLVCNCVMGVMPVNNYNGQVLSLALPLEIALTIRNGINHEAINY